MISDRKKDDQSIVSLVEKRASGLSEQERYFFDLNGYVTIPSVLSKKEVDHLNDVFDAQNLEAPAESGPG